MFYLISNNSIIQTEETPFEVHDDLIWVEADLVPNGYKAVYRDNQIVFEEMPVLVPDYSIQSKAGRDVVFCIGYCFPNKGFVNPNRQNGSYSQYSLLIEGSGYCSSSNNDTTMTFDQVGNLYNLEIFKGAPINYGSYGNGARWVAVNPINVESLNVTSIAGPNNQTITDNTTGITILNAKGEVTVNGTQLNLNDPTFYHENTQLDIQVSNDSYAILVRY